MAIDGDPEERIHGSVDETEAIRLVFIKAEFIAFSSLVRITIIPTHISAVDQAIIKTRRPMKLLPWLKLMNGRMGPIIKDDQANVLIIVRTRGAVNDDGSKDAIVGLQRKVGVVPRGAVLGGFELIRDG